MDINSLSLSLSLSLRILSYCSYSVYFSKQKQSDSKIDELSLAKVKLEDQLSQEKKKREELERTIKLVPLKFKLAFRIYSSPRISSILIMCALFVLLSLNCSYHCCNHWQHCPSFIHTLSVPLAPILNFTQHYQVVPLDFETGCGR